MGEPRFNADTGAETTQQEESSMKLQKQASYIRGQIQLFENQVIIKSEANFKSRADKFLTLGLPESLSITL